MVDDSEKLLLKRALLKDVAYLCRHVDRQWNEPIVKTLRDIREAGTPAVFFGGTLRSLLISRLFENRLGRPRDVDVVVAGTTVEKLKQRLGRNHMRETRFGGLRFERMQWQFDVWPLNRTWAFVQDEVVNPDFAALPRTTFLNLEAIAVDVWPRTPGCARRIFSGDDQFFEGILSRTLELNREENPYPALCVVRSLLLAAKLDFFIGPRLAEYLSLHGSSVSKNELDDVQRKHYGTIRYDGNTLKRWIAGITDTIHSESRSAIKLPRTRQLRFWPDEAEGLNSPRTCAIGRGSLSAETHDA